MMKGPFTFIVIQPRLPGGLYVLHQACVLPVWRPSAVAGKDHGRAVDIEEAGHFQYPHVCRSVHRQPGAGDGTMPLDD